MNFSIYIVVRLTTVGYDIDYHTLAIMPREIYFWNDARAFHQSVKVSNGIAQCILIELINFSSAFSLEFQDDSL